MIIYKYIKDFYKYDPEEEKFCKENNIVFFKPNKKRVQWLENWLKEFTPPKIDCREDIICYWRHFGTWGMYHPEDNSISICPFKIENAPGGLKETIKHEITHLKYPEANTMSHKDKERFINNKLK